MSEWWAGWVVGYVCFRETGTRWFRGPVAKADGVVKDGGSGGFG